MPRRPLLANISFDTSHEDFGMRETWAWILTSSVGVEKKKHAIPAPHPAIYICARLGMKGSFSPVNPPPAWWCCCCWCSCWWCCRSKTRSKLPYDTNRIAFKPANPTTGAKTPLNSELIYIDATFFSCCPTFHAICIIPLTPSYRTRRVNVCHALGGASLFIVAVDLGACSRAFAIQTNKPVGWLPSILFHPVPFSLYLQYIERTTDNDACCTSNPT